MKELISIVTFLLLVFSCRQEAKEIIHLPGNINWSQDSIRKYFKDSIAHRMYNGRMGQGDSLNDFDKFSKYIMSGTKAKNISDPFMLGFDEEYIDTTKIDSVKRWFRISINPVFRTPYCLILEQMAGKSTLTLKMANGHGGYYSGYLDFVATKQFEDSLYYSISQKLHQIGFWRITEDTTCSGGLDGEIWTFEAIENGKYNILTRWAPLHCGNAATKQLALVGVQLRDSSRFKEYLHVKTGMGRTEIDNWYPDR
ncbi:hypothetical protein [Paraflavitalea sp. CAU 1676]|uniref:hypothetical protein n=1 Tax=Paraflavitalea sp. CAU 1676 TaxID=3032598 RepID=UPI0023DBA593|nr:hypothetical protein [Paraflavitalea sp. CAU 1676]MDF2188528.1 hypothetical protein [Paraflavitalea sp. CAU 1676]